MSGDGFLLSDLGLGAEKARGWPGCCRCCTNGLSLRLRLGAGGAPGHQPAAAATIWADPDWQDEAAAFSQRSQPTPPFHVRPDSPQGPPRQASCSSNGSSEADSSSDPTDQEVTGKSPDMRSTPMSSTGTPSQSQHNEPTERTIQ